MQSLRVSVKALGCRVGRASARRVGEHDRARLRVLARPSAIARSVAPARAVEFQRGWRAPRLERGPAAPASPCRRREEFVLRGTKNHLRSRSGLPALKTAPARVFPVDIDQTPPFEAPQRSLTWKKPR